MKLSHAFLSLSAAALAVVPAQAQGLFSFDPAEGGFIVSGFVGAAFPSDVEYTGIQNPVAGVPGAAGADAVIDAEFDTSVTFGGSVGYQLPFKYWSIFHPRLEVEISTFESDVDDGAFNGGGLNFAGDQRVTSYLINNYSDIVWRDDQQIVPFIGGGIGVATVDANIVYQGGAPGAPNPTFAVEGSDTEFTSTFGGGVSLRTFSQFEIYTEARYTTVYNIEQDRVFVPNGGFSAEVDDDLNHTSVTVGARLRF